MNREIKFRAWIERTKQMINVDVLAISSCTWSCPDFGKQGISLAHQSHIPVMQFTGLFDKNGKEIYEGDIIDLSGTYKYKVVFEEAKFVCYHVIERYGRCGDLKRLFDPDFSEYHFQVIGNIYENPDLLEKVKEVTNG